MDEVRTCGQLFVFRDRHQFFHFQRRVVPTSRYVPTSVGQQDKGQGPPDLNNARESKQSTKRAGSQAQRQHFQTSPKLALAHEDQLTSQDQPDRRTLLCYLGVSALFCPACLWKSWKVESQHQGLARPFLLGTLNYLQLAVASG